MQSGFFNIPLKILPAVKEKRTLAQLIETVLDLQVDIIQSKDVDTNSAGV